LAQLVLRITRMRLPAVCLLGLVLASCGLSMNPDLPSAKEEKPPFFGDGDHLVGNDSDPDNATEGLGGAAPDCEPPGGAAGGLPECKEP
jgi:hypothetical protein